MQRKNQKGLTLVELIVAFTVLLILTSMAVPLARARVRVERERELRAALRGGVRALCGVCDRRQVAARVLPHAGVDRALG